MNPGFNRKYFPSRGQMETLWQNSPYGDVGAYIGGINFKGRSPTGEEIADAVNLGWGIIPTWVGLQAPCAYEASSFILFSGEPALARLQGISEGKQAVVAARRLGLASTVIYYDMELYHASCGLAVEAFVQGWDSALHRLGFLAGVYGAPFNAYRNWAHVVPPPDDVWLYDWNGRASVFGLVNTAQRLLEPPSANPPVQQGRLSGLGRPRFRAFRSRPGGCCASGQ